MREAAIAETIRTRPIDVSHCDLLAALHEECFPKPWGRDAFAALLGMPGSMGILAESNGSAGQHEPAGYVLARDTGAEWEILSLGVRPCFRRRGVGRALMACVLTRIPAELPSGLVLEVAADNVAAQELYADLGFQPVGRRPRYYNRSDSTPVDALILKRCL